MAVTSFVAGALPLTMTLSQSQLRLISSIGVGILVGTSMTVIIPEGIESLLSHSQAHLHSAPAAPATPAAPAVRRDLSANSVGLPVVPVIDVLGGQSIQRDILSAIDDVVPRRDEASDHADDHAGPAAPAPPTDEPTVFVPTFSIGFSLITGFLLMFLIDRLPRHAAERLSPPAPREISLDNLGADSHSDEETAGFLSSLSPSSPHSSSNALTVGLVIHAAADGIAMGASSSTQNTQLGFIIFLAIMVHKAPAAFGLTSVLLKQGVSKYVARGHLLVFSLAAPCGALATWLLIHLLGGESAMQGAKGHHWTGMLLLFSAGTFLYVAMHAMQEESGNHEGHPSNGYPDSPHRKRSGPQMRDTLATAAGFLLPLIAQMAHSD
ncbi:hypothetical protein TD95_000398 [Thielaviopsis punctulata]|uniref:Zinc/iron permease n=1 Tax=Thielaviopsis punctulata TaxID=72032 RepID=A0A0F4ZA39_9PEZI|nr:hypothetical protein TD95_000398 [Thielaviopsis punctulata]